MSTKVISLDEENLLIDDKSHLSNVKRFQLDAMAALRSQNGKVVGLIPALYTGHLNEIKCGRLFSKSDLSRISFFKHRP